MSNLSDNSSQNQIPKREQTIGILFFNHAISLLFSELLNSRGIEAVQISDPIDCSNYHKVITEDSYIKYLSEDLLSKSIIVGSCEFIDSNKVHQLTRPLTEEKIESALRYLLEVSIEE